MSPLGRMLVAKAMRRILTACTLAVLPFAFGCHGSAGDVRPDERNAQDPEAVEARRVVIDGFEDPADVESLARQLEGLAEVHTARVRIRKSDDDKIKAEIELGGYDLPSDELLRQEIREHGAFDDADVRTEPISAEALMSGAEADEGKSKDQIRAEVEERLRAEGVEGEVHVDIHDEDGQRRVEVRVEKKDSAPSDDAPDDLATPPQ